MPKGKGKGNSLNAGAGPAQSPKTLPSVDPWLAVVPPGLPDSGLPRPAPSSHTHQGSKPQWGSGSGVSFQPQRRRCPLHLASRFELESSPDIPSQHVSSSSGILRFFLTHGPPHETTPTFLVDSNHVDSEKGNRQYLSFSSSTQTPDSSTTSSPYYHDQPCESKRCYERQSLILFLP